MVFPGHGIFLGDLVKLGNLPKLGDWLKLGKLQISFHPGAALNSLCNHYIAGAYILYNRVRKRSDKVR